MDIHRSMLYGVSERLHSLPRVGSRAVDAEVERLKQAGYSFLPLKPYPDRPLPPHIIEAAIRAARNPHNAPSRGLPDLLQAVAQRLATEMPVTIDPEKEILVTGGGMHALFVSFGAVMGPGDQAIVPAPCYFLQGIADLLGFELVYVPMSEEQGYRWDYDRIAAAITPRTRAIFVNTPVNPTGVVLDSNDLSAISRLAERNEIGRAHV
jgi:aspartate aminotransferase